MITTITAINTTIIMRTADPASNTALLRLMTWLSPAFPVGAFSYSHGVERAVDEGLIHDRASLQNWLSDLLNYGSVWNDAVLFAASWREANAGADVTDIAMLGEAMAGSKERHMETMLQGNAFLLAIGHWDAESSGPSGEIPYPVAVAAVAARNGVALEPAVAAYLHAVLSNLIQAAVRLVPLGQSHGVALMANMEKPILTIAARATSSSLNDLGSAAIMSDIMAMQHETQYSRVFRS
ncbi:urease accessory protein UreF [Phyllobacterium brassicacearum]|uniref:Urease accessory protein UreF n=1 Tax=Phyllobacterium brassicacearum TaxID=314235 RepID=A0A2P7BWS5_9HYPH|nr:urease accessory protein UreF [Phyllobacterium brassicacearum]TDQ35579.1 urease accessory protein [Phyllobacterium brassicacearum]